jgi:hypothetical protein
LQWSPSPHTKSVYQLSLDQTVVGSLAWQDRKQATAILGGKELRVKSEGWWNPRVVIRSPSPRVEPIVAPFSWDSKAQLDLPATAPLLYQPIDYSGTRAQWRDEEGGSWLQRTCKHHWGGQLTGSMLIEAAHPALSLLVSLGWFLVIAFAESNRRSPV